MNVVLYMDSFNNDYINFLETKENIVTDGVFTKIMYSNTLFTMNGLFFYFPIEIQDITSNSYNKTFVKFDTSYGINNTIISHLTNIEHSILNLYNKSKTKNLVFKNQLSTGYIKIHTTKTVTKNTLFIVKISGIWENDNNMGITYKITPVSEIVDNNVG